MMTMCHFILIQFVSLQTNSILFRLFFYYFSFIQFCALEKLFFPDFSGVIYQQKLVIAIYLFFSLLLQPILFRSLHKFLFVFLFPFFSFVLFFSSFSCPNLIFYIFLHHSTSFLIFLPFIIPGHSYTFDMQVQGKFKKVPEGELFMGAEITRKMELGLFTKGICSSILQIVRAVNPYLHHSFGDNKDFELPHIVGPMWSLFDRLEITPPGGTIPILGGLLNEDSGHRSKRRKIPNYRVDVNLEDTYSMSFKTSSLELVDWTIVKVPVMGEMDLHTYVHTMIVLIVLFCFFLSFFLSVRLAYVLLSFLLTN